MVTSEKGIELIKKHEGCRLEAYKCPAGVWTIGCGHTRTAKEGMEITEAEAEELLKSDLKTAEKAVNRHGLNINQNKFDALVSFVFNVGQGNFDNSTLLKKIKAGAEPHEIKNEFMKWVYAKGVKLPGLVKRRRDEAELYFSK